MKNLLIAFLLFMSFENSQARTTSSQLAAVQTQKKVSGIISHYEPMENSALISIVGGQVVYIIKNLTHFSEEKLAKIFSSMSEGAPVELTIKGENEIVDIQSVVHF